MYSTTVLTVLLGLLSAAGWGSADFCGGLASRRASPFSVLMISEVTGILVLLPLPFLFGEALPGATILAISSLAGLGGAVGLMLLYRALAEGQMSVAAPVSGLVAATVPVAVGAITTGLPGSLTLAGFALALLSIWLISTGGIREGGLRLHLQGLGLPAVAGLTFGAYFVFTNLAGQSATYWPLVSSRTLSTIFLGIFMLWRRQRVEISSLPTRQAILGGTLDVLANLSYVLSGQLGRLDVSAVLGSLYPGATVLLAALVLKEHLTRTQAAGIVTALVAILLIAS